MFAKYYFKAKGFCFVLVFGNICLYSITTNQIPINLVYKDGKIENKYK